jgi:hypothetical protein
MGRNLLFAGVAGFALIARLIFDGWQKAAWLSGSRVRRILLRLLFWAFVLIHILLALIAKLAAPPLTNDLMQQMNVTTQVGDPNLMGQNDVMIVNAPNPASLFYVPYREALAGHTLPSSIRVLAPGYGPIQIHRPDAQTLDIKALEASLLTCRPTTRLEIVHLYRYLSDVRNAKDPPVDHVDLPGLSIDVLTRDTAGQPIAIRCQFPTPLEHENRQWRRWDWQQECYKPFVLPQIGQSLQLKGPY